MFRLFFVINKIKNEYHKKGKKTTYFKQHDAGKCALTFKAFKVFQ